MDKHDGYRLTKVGRWLAVLATAALPAAPQGGWAGSASCTPCHPRHALNYAKTAMAQTSGFTAGSRVNAGEVTHPLAGARYEIAENGTISFSAGPVQGSRHAALFIGSGAAARSYVWRDRDGFLFQLPVSWYASSGWGISPGYELLRTIDIARPIEAECLECHATRVQARPGTRNAYAWPPVAEAGIGCERCHGPGANHVTAGTKDSIVNPARLTPQKRDSVCAQCHLTGVERIFRAGRSPGQFRPGDDFNAHAVAFVWDPPDKNEVHVTSHFERLAKSRCKQKSGDKLWCGTCHDPHTQPVRAEITASYRTKCRGCHAGSAHVRQDGDCIGCHMPSATAIDAARTRFTDHSIPRIAMSVRTAGARQLTAFSTAATTREFGLAWTRVANAGKREEDFQRARRMLREARDASEDDPAVLTALGFLEDRSGDAVRARTLYEKAMRLGEHNGEALVNFGSIYASNGNLPDAIRLWLRATELSPGLEAAWIKLATAYIVTGRHEAARDAVVKCLALHPTSERAVALLRSLQVP